MLSTTNVVEATTTATATQTTISYIHIQRLANQAETAITAINNNKSA